METQLHNFGTKGELVRKIEFWVATAIFLMFVMARIDEYDDGARGVGFFTDREILVAVSCYFGFLLLNFIAVPRLLKRQTMFIGIGMILATLAALALVYRQVDVAFVGLFLFTSYFVVKYLALFSWVNAEAIRSKYRFLAPGTLLVLTLLLVSNFFFLVGDAEEGALVIWDTLFLFGIVLYSYSFHVLIPEAFTTPRPLRTYILKVLTLLLTTAIPLSFVAFVISQNLNVAVLAGFLNFFFQFLIIVPFSWQLHKRYRQGAEELSSLKKELGQSAASIDFLRSQINPHFLFNALNTLYGTALQEKAERTSEGIQKLGDMMRFMLHENMQEKIPLAREVEYLHNYINLQRLRTDPIPTVEIKAEIELPVTYVQIAPMLLIPFVENAFKHGISFREPSYIKITLELIGNRLNFDVSNSRHPKSDNDPEKNKNGVGLQNVRQRLQLLYPDKHELQIRETGKEFFIHLTIQLT